MFQYLRYFAYKHIKYIQSICTSLIMIVCVYLYNNHTNDIKNLILFSGGIIVPLFYGLFEKTKQDINTRNSKLWNMNCKLNQISYYIRLGLRGTINYSIFYGDFINETGQVLLSLKDDELNQLFMNFNRAEDCLPSIQIDTKNGIILGVPNNIDPIWKQFKANIENLGLKIIKELECTKNPNKLAILEFRLYDSVNEWINCNTQVAKLHKLV